MAHYQVRVDTDSGRVGVSKAGHYKTARGAVRGFGRKFANGEPCIIEVFSDARKLAPQKPWILQFNEQFERI